MLTFKPTIQGIGVMVWEAKTPKGNTARITQTVRTGACSYALIARAGYRLTGKSQIPCYADAEALVNDRIAKLEM